MNLEDYLVEFAKLPFSALMANWRWLIPTGTKMEPWLMNCFGDLFWFDDAGRVQLLNVTEGDCEVLADSEDEFFDRLAELENAQMWLMLDFVDEIVEAHGKLRPGQCYGFKELPILGGEYEVDNVYVSPIVKYWDFCGDVHEQIDRLPDGAEIEINVPER